MQRWTAAMEFYIWCTNWNSIKHNVIHREGTRVILESALIVPHSLSHFSWPSKIFLLSRRKEIRCAECSVISVLHDTGLFDNCANLLKSHHLLAAVIGCWDSDENDDWSLFGSTALTNSSVLQIISFLYCTNHLIPPSLEIREYYSLPSSSCDKLESLI